MAKLQDKYRTPARPPLAYFITVRTYGTWLHGDPRGAVDRDHNHFKTSLLEEDPTKQHSEAARLKHPPTVLTADAAIIVERTIREVCAHRNWRLFEVAARTNHFHAVVSATATAERAMNDLKAWATRRLREAGVMGKAQEVWSQHGSTPHLWTDAELAAAIGYVRTGQGPPLAGNAPGNP